MHLIQTSVYLCYGDDKRESEVSRTGTLFEDLTHKIKLYWIEHLFLKVAREHCRVLCLPHQAGKTHFEMGRIYLAASSYVGRDEGKFLKSMCEIVPMINRQRSRNRDD